MYEYKAVLDVLGVYFIFLSSCLVHGGVSVLLCRLRHLILDSLDFWMVRLNKP
jgi:hypothetical protein